MKSKKFLKFIISVSTVLFFSAALSSIGNAEDVKKGTVTSQNGLNVRAEASLKSKIISVLSPKSTVELLEDSGDWYKINAGSAYGYIRKEFIELDSGDEASTASAANLSADTAKDKSESKSTENSGVIKGIVLTEKGLNLRDEASADSKIIELLSPGTEVEVLEVSNIWCKIKTDKNTGYVSKQYLKLNSEDLQAAQSSTAAAVSKNTTVKGTVLTQNGLNLRAAGNLTSKVLSTIKPNTLVMVIEQSGDWYKVKTDNAEGYAFKQFIKIE